VIASLPTARVASHKVEAEQKLAAD